MRFADVDRFGAFGVNAVGLTGAAFPLSITVQEVESIWTIYGTALQTADAADLLADLALPVSLALNIGQVSLFGPDRITPLKTSEIASLRGVDARVYDLTWQSDYGGGELLTLDTADLPKLFRGWSVYDVDLLDRGSPPSAGDVDEAAVSVNSWQSSDAPLLRQLRSSSTYYAGHDDCYFYAESRKSDLPTRIFARLLASLAGSALVVDDDAVTIAEPLEELVTVLFDRSASWTGVVTACTDGEVTIGLVSESWRLGEPIPADYSKSLRYDSNGTGSWHVDA